MALAACCCVTGVAESCCKTKSSLRRDSWGAMIARIDHKFVCCNAFCITYFVVARDVIGLTRDVLAEACWAVF